MDFGQAALWRQSQPFNPSAGPGSPAWQTGSEVALHLGPAQFGAMPFPNRIPPLRLATAERLDEIAELLTRLIARQSTRKSAETGESSLDCLGGQSGDADVLSGGVA
jgi:hypothetical protein